MTFNEHNRNAFHFFNATYKDIKKMAQPYMDYIGATKFGYFRLYQGGNYLIFTNDFLFTRDFLFLLQEISPIYMQTMCRVKENELFFYKAPTIGCDSMIRLLKQLWGEQSVMYCRHKNYIDAIVFSNHINPEAHTIHCANNIPLFKKLYWIIREEILQFLPHDKTKIFAHFPKGADITYHPKRDMVFFNPSRSVLNQEFCKVLSYHHPYLSHRECEVCLGLMRGETAKEMAERLNIEKRTVENHLQNIYKKLAEKWGFRPSRAQILEKLYDTMDKELLTQILWGTNPNTLIETQNMRIQI